LYETATAHPLRSIAVRIPKARLRRRDPFVEKQHIAGAPSVAPLGAQQALSDLPLCDSPVRIAGTARQVPDQKPQKHRR
jgi:hypothetical protein